MLNREQFGFNAFWWETLHDAEQIESCVRCLSGLGYRQVEFKRDSFLQEQLPKQFAMAARVAGEQGLKVSNFVVLRDLVGGDEQAIADVVETIEACSEAQVGLLNCCFGLIPPPIAPPAEQWWAQAQPCHGPAWDNLVSALEEICAAAQRHGVVMVMEATIGAIVHDFYSIQELLARCDHPCLGLTLDPSHLFLYRNDIPYAIRRLGDRIRHVHVKDAIGVPGTNLEFAFPVLGAGGIDWTAFFTALDEIDYAGALSAEYEQFKYMAVVLRNDPVPAAAETFRAMSVLFDHYQEHYKESER